MEWQDKGIILGVRRHGETSVIVEMMTRARGRHLGLVRGGRSRRMQPVLQPGNLVAVAWRARLDEHLGTFQIEPVALRAGELMIQPTGLYGVQALAALLRLIPEREPHPHLFDRLDITLGHLTDAVDAGELFVRFELAILDDLGFGLDLGRCAATGAAHDLAYVSPKTGRAVGRDAGAPYADRLLPLPPFLLRGARAAADRQSLAAAFGLTRFFFDRHVYEPRGLAVPMARESFVRAALKVLGEGGGVAVGADMA